MEYSPLHRPRRQIVCRPSHKGPTHTLSWAFIKGNAKRFLQVKT
jgi:hypothetical protein